MAPSQKQSKKRSGRSALKDVVTREYTVHIQKFVRDKQFKKRTPNAIKGIILFARRHMGTKDVRIDPKLNEAVWAKGVRYPPRRIRIRLERKRNDDEDAKEKLYTYATHVPGITDFHGLQNEVIDTD
ncbi:60S ribosomal protein L31 [Tulasnella sp. 424]|nr:60S ribosomal protein L31 [Tulasnella sp. 424]KAG8961907.1 60S ribosomal protein L31 [Tulasnella sp. 425]